MMCSSGSPRSLLAPSLARFICRAPLPTSIPAIGTGIIPVVAYIFPLSVKDTSSFHIVFVPVVRSELLPRLTAGRGDIAVATLTVTPDRRKLVDFSDPTATGVREASSGS
jgi:ABC-type amino acid transport substrate-binding protein